MLQETDKSNLIEALKDCGAVQYGDFTLSSGKKSSYYINIKKAITKPNILDFIAEKMVDFIETKDVTAVGGVELGGVPLATAVSLKSGLPLLIVRKSSKEYGVKEKFIGNINDEQSIFLIEDVTTSGKSVIDAITSIKETGSLVKGVITVVDRNESAFENLNNIGINLYSLINVNDLVNKQ
ncbi:orotate phosphoribosyltransferase [Methanosalsum natronophilum]|uniref:Orotate phosphoribosyltransferase n=1 Tax=Methanosalsum natronophilum TaxID=768733 RepID=A0A3R7VTQ1_9EURY|nr:orotate phosphoribosyltransferase [Methanosalsum natronophilum]MCS3924721.1 orotate phosphoribosyltransferase [Methanosalsum natronophilum]RQD86739.1 MAG: orotate phosphoribosyltransferase [Methanosalsum natronophilum]